MPTLSEATSVTKKIAIFGGAGILSLILLFFLSKGALSLYSILFPKPGPPPEAAFSTLPALIFPDTIKEKFSYTIDTISGNLGSFPDRTKIYKTVTNEPNLLSLRTAQGLINQTRFTFNQTKLNDTTYAWNEQIRPEKRLTFNIVSKDFTIESNFLTYPDLSTTSRVSEENAKNEVTEFLGVLGLYPYDIDINQTRVDMLKLEKEKLVAALSLSDAEVVRVDLYQTNIDKMKIVYPDPPHSTMHFIVGGPATTEIMEATFSHQAISKESSTYPIISVNQAFANLKKGNAYIGAYFGSSNEITIKEVYLAYYLGTQKQEYLMPVYVFEGKDGFYAYVSATDPNWIEKSN